MSFQSQFPRAPGIEPELVVDIERDYMVTVCGSAHIRYYGVQGHYRLGQEIESPVRCKRVAPMVHWSPWSGVDDE